MSDYNSWGEKIARKLREERMEKVSIIMPCYNDGLFIEEAIDSVLRQTYKNIEIIVIDDGSDDDYTKKVLSRLSNEKMKICHTKHLRPAGARNYGISLAAGKYILPVDSDDRIEPTYIERAVSLLENNSHVGVVYCEADLFGERSGKWDLPPYSFEAMLLDNIVFVTAMFYKSDWEKVGGFNTYMDLGMEDYDFWLSILALGREIYQIPEVLFHYRIKKVSRTTQFMDNSIQVKGIYRKIYDNHEEFYLKNAKQYAQILRAALIEQTFLRRRYEFELEEMKKKNEQSSPFFMKWINGIVKGMKRIEGKI